MTVNPSGSPLPPSREEQPSGSPLPPEPGPAGTQAGSPLPPEPEEEASGSPLPPDPPGVEDILRPPPA
jgi:hypothetical protein